MKKSTKDCIELLNHISGILEKNKEGFACVLIPSSKGMTLYVPKSTPESIMDLIMESDNIEVSQVLITKLN